MLIQLVTQHPEAIPSIVRGTPNWVWALATALAALGISQLFARRASLTRVLVMPAAMLAFAVYGIVSAFAVPGQSAAVLTGVFAAWMVTVATTLGLLSGLRAPGAARGDAGVAGRRPFRLVSQIADRFLQRTAVVHFVFDDQNAGGIHVGSLSARGNSRRKQAPGPAGSTAASVPPFCSTAVRARNRPSPVPCGRVV